MAHEIKLYKYFGDEVGVETLAWVCNQLLDEDLERLKVIPGAYESYLKFNNMKLEVCTVVDQKVSISKHALATFQDAPPSVKERLVSLETDHTHTWEDALGIFKYDTSTVVLLDPRSPVPEVTNSTASYPILPRLDVFLQNVHIIARVKCLSDTLLTLMEDSDHCVYALSETMDYVVERGTTLGSAGPGTLVDDTPDLVTTCVVPLELDSDRKWVGVFTFDQDSNKTRLRRGSLYAVAKELMKQTKGMPISIQPVGRLISRLASESHLHGFDFEHPIGSDGYQRNVYVLHNNDGDTSVKNSDTLFRGLANRKGIAGCVDWMYLYTFNHVNGKLTAARPVVIATEDICLKMGVPLKIAWPKE